MKTSSIVGGDLEEEDPNDINKIIKKYESNIMILNNNKSENIIKKDELIDRKNTDFTSQYSKRTKNSSNNSDKTYENNNNINMKLYEEDLNKNISSSIVNKSIKTNTNSNKINKNDIEINIQNNIKNNNINDINNKNFNNKNLHNNQNVLLSLEKNYKTDKNNTIYDTSFNMLYNPYDNSKFFLNKSKNISLLKDNNSKIIRSIINIQEEQLKKELPLKKNNKINNEDKYISKKYNKYLKKLFKKKKKGKNIKKKNKLDLNNHKKKCNCLNWLIMIRNILIFIIISSAVIFYTFVFFC